ncbi:uncharacterized protein EDB91DRAFT_1082775 [Suillus paluster]|uniref:uncharacterized protein n=1 Tax=Suillus paluster TaxID=48578 RepID=UPI001B87A064|nr:uncharacterized protein EDB91DRAFT_1082775 [Suillus paluster]KAG1738385.1 hypothetical protein EDB91DRAFT_1082775 [Suillus paluster]
MMSSTSKDILELGRVLWGLNAYDYFLTLADEVPLAVFFSRYTGLKAVTMEMGEAPLLCLSISYLLLLDIGDARGISTHDVNSYLGGFIVNLQGVFLTRVCAIWGFRRRIVVPFLISGLMYVIAAIVVLSII